MIMKDRSETIAFHRNYCTHYQPRETLCGAGVNWLKLDRVPTTIGTAKVGPCIGGHLLENTTGICPHWERPSQEEGEAYADSIEALLTRMAVVDPVINAWRKKPPIGKREVIECPACKGRLHLSQAAYNGHVRAKCETAACVAFIE